MKNEQESMFHITITEHQDGCCHDCDPSYGQPYSDPRYVSATEYGELMDNEWDRERVTHVRKLTPNELDAYYKGKQQSEHDFYLGRHEREIKASKALLLIVYRLGSTLRKHDIEIPWDVEWDIDLNDLHNEFSDVFSWSGWDSIPSVFRRGIKATDEARRLFATDNTTLIKLVDEYAPVPTDPATDGLADWEKELLRMQEKRDDE